MASRRSRTNPVSQPQELARQTYDELDPKSEWKDDPAAHVLNVYLPGFEKHQMKVRLDQVTKTLNVIAERTDRNNRMVRVNKDYRIPGNSNLKDMRGKSDNQTLTITIPKEIASQVDPKPKLPEATKTTQKPPSTQKPQNERSPTLPVAPPPPPEKQKLEEKPDRIPSILPDPWREMGEGRDFPDPSVLKGKNKAKFLKEEDENENETETPPPSRTQKPHSEKIPTLAAAPPSSPEKQQLEEKPAVFPFLLPDPWREMAEGRDFPDPSVLKKTTKAEFSWKGKGPEERKEHHSEQEMKMSNDIPGNEELEMKMKEETRGEEIDIYAAARKAMLDLTMRIREDRQSVINMGVAALMIVALGTFISYTIGLSREGDNN